MPKIVKIVKHQSLRELESAFRNSREMVEKTHYQVILLRSQGYTSSEVAKICGYKIDWVNRLIRRYNENGPSGIADRRKENRKEQLLTKKQQQELREAVLEEEPAEGGLWTGPKVAQWMANKTGRDVWPQLAWVYLKRLGLSKQSPRPKNPKACLIAQEEFKKNFANK